MTDLEACVAATIPAETPPEIAGRVLPSLAHCIGQQKLLGAHYGQALCEECGLKDDGHRQHFTLLACLLRTYIVIDDFLKDNDINRAAYPSIEKWLNNIRNRCITYMQEYTNDPVRLWTKYEALYQSAYLRFDRQDPFHSVVCKCAFVLLPLELVPASVRESSDAFGRFVSHYLFALQLVDDFQDMEEDRRAARNQNLFWLPSDAICAHDPAVLRPFLIRGLISYVEDNLRYLLPLVSGDTARMFLAHSLSWLRGRDFLCKDLPFFNAFSGDFQSFQFSMHEVSSIGDTNWSAAIPEFDSFTAECMHTVRQLVSTG